MKKTLLTASLSCLAIVAISQQAFADDRAGSLSIKEAMKPALVQKAKLGDSVSFYFGSQSHPAVEKKLGSATGLQNTSAFLKSDFNACSWGFLGALKKLRNQAEEAGGNAVINIQSYFMTTKNKPMVSTKYVTCAIGAASARIVLRGEIVKLKN